MDSRASLVELVFSKCSLVYGRDFLGRWEGLKLGEVKADWIRELGPLLDSPQAIKHGLEHLPADRPPNVLQFRQLCLSMPRAQLPALPPLVTTTADRARVRKLLEQAKASITGRKRVE